jgi:hypothetical protein
MFKIEISDNSQLESAIKAMNFESRLMLASIQHGENNDRELSEEEKCTFE